MPGGARRRGTASPNLHAARADDAPEARARPTSRGGSRRRTHRSARPCRPRNRRRSPHRSPCWKDSNPCRGRSTSTPANRGPGRAAAPRLDVRRLHVPRGRPASRVGACAQCLRRGSGACGVARARSASTCPRERAARRGQAIRGARPRGRRGVGGAPVRERREAFSSSSPWRAEHPMAGAQGTPQPRERGWNSSDAGRRAERGSRSRPRRPRGAGIARIIGAPHGYRTSRRHPLPRRAGQPRRHGPDRGPARRSSHRRARGCGRRLRGRGHREQPALRRRGDAGADPHVGRTPSRHHEDRRENRCRPTASGHAEFVREHTGQVIGGVSPIGHPAPVRTYLDPWLHRYDEVWAAAGHPAAVFSTSAAELLVLTGATEIEVE